MLQGFAPLRGFGYPSAALTNIVTGESGSDDRKIAPSPDDDKETQAGAPAETRNHSVFR